MPDWNVIAAWAGGIATVVGSVIVSIWLAINRALQIAKTVPPPVTTTDIITTDSVAYEKLGFTLEANTLEMAQTNRLLMDVVSVGKDFTEMIRKQREEAEFEAEVEKRVHARLKAARRRTGTTPAARKRTPKTTDET